MRSKIREKRVIYLSIIVFLIFIITFLIVTKPKILVYYNNQIVDRVIDVEVFDNFEYPTIKANYLKKNIKDKIKINGSVDSKKIGEYKIEYSLKIFIYNIKKIIYVNVVDNEKPQITLKGNNPSHTCSIQTYKEEGFEASDNYDGNIIDKVISNINNDEVVYSVTDSSGNKVSVKRKLIVSDDEAPIIKLKGSKNVYIKLGSTYSEKGYTVTDNCDESVTNIKVDNKVDTSKVGSYEVTYTAIDSSDNKSTIKREVYVYDPQTSASFSGGKKGVIYLTFDDGPSSYTPKILDILKKYNIKATFFVTNNGSDSYIKREFNEGHTVALHTATHSYKKVYASDEAYFKDLESVQNRVYKITKQKSTIIRFPGGSSNTISKYYSKGIMTRITSEVLKRGYHYFDWTTSVEDAGSCASKKTMSLKEECIFSKYKK